MKKVKKSEPDFIQRTVEIIYLDSSGGVKHHSSRTINDPTPQYKKKVAKNIKK
jgi:hypothetical protein